MWHLVQSGNEYILIETDSNDITLGWVLTKRSGAWGNSIAELCGDYRKDTYPENLYTWIKEYDYTILLSFNTSGKPLKYIIKHHPEFLI